jgi:hypothetical protein
MGLRSSSKKKLEEERIKVLEGPLKWTGRLMSN